VSVPPNLVLVGFMASGKSAIGSQCARALGFGFRDSDKLVERRAGRTIPEIFDEEGEPAFRQMEAAALRDLARQSRVVIATGGGAVMNGTNVAQLRRTGVVILLWASVEDILRRAGSRLSRPLLADAEDPRARIESLLAEREQAYRSAAHAVAETSGLSRDEAVERVLDLYRQQAARWQARLSRPSGGRA
jgi:shikimate kinase